MNSKISVIIPVYNVEPFIKQCVDSILKQTYSNLEIILVDDGSPDNCPEICDEYSKIDNRVKVVHKINGGLSSARNSGLKVATGDFVCFFDSDDYIEKDMLEKMINCAVEKNSDLCICGYFVDYYNEFGNLTSTFEVLPKYSTVKNDLSLKEYEFILGLSGYAWNKLYKREFLSKIDLKFIEGVSLVEDLLFNKQVFCNTQNYAFIDYAGYHYIQRKRETLGLKYYKNYFELKEMAISSKRDILNSWRISNETINQFYDNNLIDISWGTVKNIQLSSLSKKEKKEKIKSFIKEKQIKKLLKNTKIQDKKRKKKRFLLINLPVWALINFVK